MVFKKRVKIINYEDGTGLEPYSKFNHGKLEAAVNHWFDKNPEILLQDIKFYNFEYDIFAIIIYKEKI